MSDSTIRLNLHLGYNHGSGALSDYFRALAEGRALAGRCGTCGRTWFPPHARCPEDGGTCRPVDLDGHGVVVSETRTRTRLPFTDKDREVTFVLVAMAGADNAAFGRLENYTGNATGERVRLVAIAGSLGHPAQGAIFKPAKEG